MSSQYDISTHVANKPASPTIVPDPNYLRRAGLLCAAGGLVAAVGSGVSVFAIAPAADAIISAPLSANTFRVLQVVWALTNVLTLFGALGLARSACAGGRAGRVGTRLAVIGMAAVIPAQLAFIPFATSTDSDTGPMIASTAIGVASMVAGAGFVVAGIAVLKTGAWSGLTRFAPLAVGVWVFVGLTPLDFVDGRAFYVGISIWNALLGALGLAIARLGANSRS